MFLGVTFGSSFVAFAQSGEERRGERKGERAEIVIEKTVHDFGKIRHGEIVSTKFPFQNAGNGTLEFYPVPDAERRVHVRVPEYPIEPAKSGHIEVTLETEGLFGEVRDSIPVFTNDPERREIFLKVTTTVRPVVAAYPPVFSVGEVAKGDSFIGTVSLMGILADEDRLSGLSLEPSSASLRAKVAKRQSSDRMIPVLEFVLLPDVKPGDIEETITIISEDPPARAYLRLFGKKEGDIRITPDRFVIMLNEDGEIKDYSVTIESDQPFHITGAEDSNDLLSFSTRTIVPDSKYELVARLKALVAGNAMGVVRIHTDMEEQPLLEIPFLVGIVQSGN